MQIVNGYMRILGMIHGNCYTVMSQTMTAIINRVALTQKIHLLTRVGYQPAI